MNPAVSISSVAAILTLAACAVAPSGPSVMSLPGTGKSFDRFRVDDSACRQYAASQLGGLTPRQASIDSGVTSAAVGAVVGAAAGAAIDGSSGAGVGAGVGLLTGALSGTEAAYGSAHVLQQRYDIGYTQCMYAKGHKVPVSGRFASMNPPAAPRFHIPPPPSPRPR